MYFNRYFPLLFAYADNSYSITINTTTHILTLYKATRIYRTYPVAVGKPSTPTPIGVY